MNKKIILSVFCIVTLLGLFAVTKPVSAMTCDSATLNGDVIVGTPPANARFYYSSDYNAVANWSISNPTGTPTQLQFFNSDGPISQLVTGLSENTTYYFRLVVANNFGTQALNIQSFTTPACQVLPPPPTQVAPTVNIWADQTNVAYASATTLHWTSNNNPQTCNGGGGSGVVGWVGPQNVSGTFNTSILTNTVTFIISCTNVAGTGTDSVTINVANQPAQTCQDPSATNYGGSLPCRYTVLTCQDTNAINYGGTLPCRYTNPIPQICQDPTATNYGGALPCRYLLMPAVSITADQINVAYNGGTVVRWTSTGTSCNATSGSNGWSGPRSPSGSFFTGPLTNTTIFNINCSNTSGSASDSVTVSVASQSAQTCQDPSATNYGGALPCRYPVNQTCQDPSATNYGGSLPCRYPTLTCQDPSATNYGGALPCRYPTQVCQDPFAINYGGSLPCRYPVAQTCPDPSAINYGGTLPCRYVNPIPQICQDYTATNYGNSLPCRYSNQRPSVYIYADDTNINFDDSTRIRWDSSNADYCRASGGTNGWSGNQNTSGSFNTGPLDNDETYRITCTNSSSGLTANDSVMISVDSNNSNNNRPSVTIFADRTNISYNQSTVIRWYPSDANYCSATGGDNGWSGSKSASGGNFNTGSLSQTTTFYINCRNSDGSDSDSVTVYVNNNNSSNYYAYTPAASAPTAITTSGIQLTNTSAQLNSLIFTGGSSNTNTWFEWGTSTNLGNSTNQSAIGALASTEQHEILGGLSTGVTYYFRAVAENSYATNYGSIMSFTMSNLSPVVGVTTTRPTTIINTSGANSLVMLSIDGGSENIAPLERRNFQVTWKNISNQTLRNVILQVILPTTINFESANKGSFNADNNTLTLEVGTLSPGESGNTFFLASTKSDLQDGALIVTVANMVYTDASNAQGEALAYATQRANLSGSVLGASALGAGFLPTTFLGWLLLLILLLIILLLSRYLYNQFKEPQPPVVIQH